MISCQQCNIQMLRGSLVFVKGKCENECVRGAMYECMIDWPVPSVLLLLSPKLVQFLQSRVFVPRNWVRCKWGFVFTYPQTRLSWCTFREGIYLFACVAWFEGNNNALLEQFVLAEILLGLEYLHQQGLVYRDLKPENILIHANRHTKVLSLSFWHLFTAACLIHKATLFVRLIWFSWQTLGQQGRWKRLPPT